ncbi:hypothetical protein ACGFNP_07115 [Nonomuraea sp. NPDC049269]
MQRLPADAAWRITAMSSYGDSDALSLKDLDDLLSPRKTSTTC